VEDLAIAEKVGRDYSFLSRCQHRARNALGVLSIPCSPAQILSGSSWRLRTSRRAPVVVKHRVARVGHACKVREHRKTLIILPWSD
jgi:hypothetical protein